MSYDCRAASPASVDDDITKEATVRTRRPVACLIVLAMAAAACSPAVSVPSNSAPSATTAWPAPTVPLATTAPSATTAPATSPPSATTPPSTALASPTQSAPTPSATPSPSAGVSPSPSTATVFRRWVRSDLPDPGPSVFGGGTVPVGVVAFHGAYFAAGWVVTSCCDGGDAWRNRGVIWTSADGRSWTLHDPIRGLKHATLIDLVTDGTRLVATGLFVAPVPNNPGEFVPAVWASSDGITWLRASGTIPSLVAAGAHGFIGAVVGSYPSTDMPYFQFVTSTDGLTWTKASEVFDGDLDGLAARPDGTAMAVGHVPGTPSADGGLSADVVVWRSADGTAWTGPEVVVNNAVPDAVTSDAGDFVALVHKQMRSPGGTYNDTSEIWRPTQVDARRPGAIALSVEESLDSIFVIGDTLIATGDTLEHGASNAMAWISTDGGATWRRLADPQAFRDINNELAGIVPTPAGLLAVGNYWDRATSHRVPSVWLAGR